VPAAKANAEVLAGPRVILNRKISSHMGWHSGHNQTVLTRSFQIQEMVFQNNDGVVFRATDVTTDIDVALRRFFPFGADGGGLNADEQAAYGIAIKRLADLEHPSLRRVMGGGCDPVDGIPFIATEWIDGENLMEILGSGTLTNEETIELARQGLEVCELLSRVLAEEAVWIDIHPASIIRSAHDPRCFTFWISPFTWLGHEDGRGSLSSVAGLVEQAKGWQNRVVGDSAGRGLGAWVNWMRGSGKQASFHEAREMLAASIGHEPPPDAVTLVRSATKHRVVLKSARPSRSGWVIAVLAILAAVLALAYWNHRVRQGGAALAAPPAPQLSMQPKVQAPRAAVSRSQEVAARAADLGATNSEKLKRFQEAMERQGGIYQIEQSAELAERSGEVQSFEGICLGVSQSSSKATSYLLFSENPVHARGRITNRSAPDELKAEALGSLVGKRLRLTGKIGTQLTGDGKRPEILLSQRTQIVTVE
jgi:hypothetical protein